jgi:hypothetical protein
MPSTTPRSKSAKSSISTTWWSRTIEPLGGSLVRC